MIADIVTLLGDDYYIVNDAPRIIDGDIQLRVKYRGISRLESRLKAHNYTVSIYSRHNINASQDDEKELLKAVEYVDGLMSSEYVFAGSGDFISGEWSGIDLTYADACNAWAG